VTLNDLVKNLILWGVIAVILLSVFSHFQQQATGSSELSYSDFIEQVKSGMVKEVVIAGREISGVAQSDQAFKTYSPETDNTALIGDLLANKVKVNAKPPEQQSLLMSIFIRCS